MSKGYGFNAVVGYGEQTTFGTSVARNKWLRVKDESLAYKGGSKPVSLLGVAGQMLSVPKKASVEGSISTPALIGGLEYLLKHAFGSVTTTPVTVGEVTYYKQEFKPTNQLPAGLSFEANRDAASLGKAFVYQDCQVNKFSLKQALEDPLEMAFDFVGSKEVLDDATAVGTFPAERIFDWSQLYATVNGTVIEVSSVDVSVENSINSDRYALGSLYRIGTNRKDVRKVTITLESEMDGLTIYNLYKAQTEFAVQLRWTGPLIAGLTDNDFHKFQIDAPRCLLDGETPSTKDFSVYKVKLPIVCYCPLNDANGDIKATLWTQDNAFAV